MSKVETVKALMTALQSGDLELAATLLAEDFTLTGLAAKALARAQFLGLQSELLAAMPDFSYHLDEVHPEGEQVKALIRITGTHTSNLSLPLFGLSSIPATGLAVSLPQSSVTYLLASDKVVSMAIDPQPGGGLAGLLQQLGSELPLMTRERNIAD